MPSSMSPLGERIARYERIVAMRSLTPPMTLEDIGAAFDPPLSKERVRQILNRPPRRPGRPAGPSRRADLQRRLRYWESRRARRASRGEDATFAAERSAALARELAGLDESE